MSAASNIARAAIAGVAESDLGAVPNRTATELAAQAAVRALDDAGLTLNDVDGLFTANLSRFSVTQLAENLALQPSYLDCTMTGGSSFEMHLGHAAAAINSGLCAVALIAYGSVQRSRKVRNIAGFNESGTSAALYENVYAPLFPISFYAMVAQRYMHEYGATSEDLAQVAVAARQWAAMNPKAFKRDPLTVADVLASPLVSSPLHGLDCCLVTDGGGAVVVTSIERGVGRGRRGARDLRHRYAQLRFVGSGDDGLQLARMERRSRAHPGFGGARATYLGQGPDHHHLTGAASEPNSARDRQMTAPQPDRRRRMAQRSSRHRRTY